MIPKKQKTLSTTPIIAEGTSELMFQKWLDKDAFVDELPAFAERSDSTYGDIFVKRK